MKRNEIIGFVDEYLKVKEFEDYCHNGLQVEGSEEVRKIVLGVSLSEKLIRAAVERGAEMLIVHHGIFMGQVGSKPRIKGVLRNRLKLLLTNDISLAGYHLPLDAHPEIGNNVSLCRMLGIEGLEKFDVGFIGKLTEAIPIGEFVSLVEKALSVKPSSLLSGPQSVKRIGVISGGASPDYEDARALSCDAFLCGDLREEVVRGAEELGINVVNAGHYNTEKEGVRNLAALLKDKFGVEAEFVDVPCEI